MRVIAVRYKPVNLEKYLQKALLETPLLSTLNGFSSVSGLYQTVETSKRQYFLPLVLSLNTCPAHLTVYKAYQWVQRFYI